ncbi:hypothetical protein GCM10023107_15630 [Actinoplanes octamycinicus]|nr:hypothetical protein Aoc01nite_19550 [Actinoplanes octamycinicus]
MTPQSIFGPRLSDMISDYPGFGSPRIGSPGIGNPITSMLPFQAGPQQQQQFAPQGIFGGALGTIAGNALGGYFGNSGLGSTIGGIAGGLLPFQAGPQQSPPFVPPYYPGVYGGQGAYGYGQAPTGQQQQMPQMAGAVN